MMMICDDGFCWVFSLDYGLLCVPMVLWLGTLWWFFDGHFMMIQILIQFASIYSAHVAQREIHPSEQAEATLFRLRWKSHFIHASHIQCRLQEKTLGIAENAASNTVCLDSPQRRNWIQQACSRSRNWQLLSGLHTFTRSSIHWAKTTSTFIHTTLDERTNCIARTAVRLWSNRRSNIISFAVACNN